MLPMHTMHEKPVKFNIFIKDVHDKGKFIYQQK